MTKSLIPLAHEGKTKWFYVDDNLLYTKRRRLYVPKWGNMRYVIKECHDSKWVEYPWTRTRTSTTRVDLLLASNTG